jgi:Y-X(10)_GDL-associated radical SAM protein
METAVELTKRPKPARFLSDADRRNHVPVYVVWELTLACNLKCQHCGSRAGGRRPDELSTRECLDVVDALASLGTREITLIGGEAYLRKDWLEIVRRIRSHGMYCGIQTGGRALTDLRLEQAVEAGLQGVGVSIDGLAQLHDRLRGLEGAFDSAISVMERATALGISVSCNTQIGPETVAELPAIMDRIIDAGATHWQVQLTVAMGNAVDNDELLLQPYELLELMPLLARLSIEGGSRGLLMMAGNNIGYFGPHEEVLRGSVDEDDGHWTGCAAGQTVIGLESDGTVKGCPSLATVGYAGGNVRDLSIEEIWHTSDEIHFGRLRSLDDLWGFCRSCYYAPVCRGGCTWTADSLLGRPGNNPYCHHRALELERSGLRERVVKVEDAPDESFAVGRFMLISEPLPGAARQPQGEQRGPPAGASVDQPRSDPRHEGIIPAELDICRACHCHIWPDETDCPHCGADVLAAKARYEEAVVRRREVILRLERLLAKHI